MRPSFVLIAGLAALWLFPGRGSAQSGVQARWEIPGYDFAPDGVYRVRARQVAQARATARARLLRSGLSGQIMPAGPYGPGGAWTGTYAVPVLLGRPVGLSTPAFASAAQVQTKLFGASTFPISLTTFYQQQSHGLMTVTGQAFGWFALSHDTVYYTGINGCAGGVVCFDATAHLRDFVLELLTSADATVDFRQYDNDGPDGTPNSPDDDGFVDLVALLHPQIGGECQSRTPPANPPSGYRHLWSHRFNLIDLNGSPFTTNDARNGGGFIKIRDYFLTGAEGAGLFGCTPGGLMEVGTFAHEFGHGLGLPDLYDVTPSGFGTTEGIGEWGLMGAGNFQVAPSPSFMEGFSRSELGWATEVTLGATGIDTLSPTEQGDTVFVVPTATAGEYFLLENRQPIESDSFVNGPGLTIYHIDRTLYDQRFFSNSVNAGTIHAVALLEADGLRQLWCESGGCNRGDAGDPYPGSSGKTALTALTTPNNLRNSGATSGFRLDSISILASRGPVRFWIRFGEESRIAANDPAAVILVDSVSYTLFRSILEPGSSHEVSVADTQFSGAGNRTRFTFTSWSDSQPQTHTFIASASGDTITAILARAHQLIATAGANGTISSNPVVNLAGEFIAAGSPVELTATPSGGFSFDGWTGDTAFSGAVITLPMGKPYTVTASFATALSISSGGTRPDGVMGAAYHDTLRVTGGTGTYGWSVTAGALPQGVTLAAATGVLSGFPRATGNFSYTARVASGAQNQSQTFTFSVTAPALATADVVTQILGPGAPLTADQVRYLDILGNNNGSFDVGDFLAWVKATGATLVQAKGGRP